MNAQLRLAPASVVTLRDGSLDVADATRLADAFPKDHQICSCKQGAPQMTHRWKAEIRRVKPASLPNCARHLNRMGDETLASDLDDEEEHGGYDSQEDRND
jgi:hypothetical protein